MTFFYNDSFNFTYPLIGSEIALSLYPQLIKLIPTTLEVQIAVRCISYAVLAILGYCITGFGNTTSTNSKQISKINMNSFSFISTIVMGIVNLVHIASSYNSFRILSSGVSYSLFYTYPIFNLIGRSIFYNEKIEFINYIYIAIAIVGVYLIYSKNNINDKIEEKKNIQEKIQEKTNNIKLIGFTSGIISAFSESLIYFMVKNDVSTVSPFIQIIKTYLFGGVISISYLIKNLDTINLDWNYWITLILFNSLIGFVGYILRFFTIPRLSTLTFNSIIFIGVIFSYIWGYIFSKEKIDKNSIIGTLLIMGSIFTINKSTTIK